MPSKNMLPKGKRRQTVKPAYRAHREALRVQEADEATAKQAALETPAGETTASGAAQHPTDAALPAEPLAEPPVDVVVFDVEDGIRSFVVDAGVAGRRLDAYLAKAMPEISRARVQLLIENGQVRLDGKVAKASYKLVGGEKVEIEGEPQPAPLKAEPEDIPLTVVYEDDDLAVINKPAGMTVHAGAGDAEHNRGTLVNALLFHFGKQLSAGGGALRPGIVHRLDKETSGLILVAKTDAAHRRLAEVFAERELEKRYVALVHGAIRGEEGTVNLPVGRDPVRRTRMTTRRSVEAGARAAVSHWRVLERFGGEGRGGALGVFTLLEVEIETGRTHQIRVHLASLGHPVVGDALYGAPGRLRPVRPAGGRLNSAPEATAEPTLNRNFLHAAALELPHPRTGKPLAFQAELPAELEAFLEKLRMASPSA